MVVFTWPLVLHISEQSLKGYDYVTPGVQIDRDQFIWDMWWVKKALIDFRINPYFTNYLYYPYGVPLYLQSLTPVNGLMGILFQDWLGALGAYNIVCLINFVWCGYSAFLLADYLIADKVSAFVAGLFFTLSPQHYFNLHQGQLNVITLQFFPLFLLFFLKLDHFKPAQAGWRGLLTSKKWWFYSFWAGFFLVLVTVSDQYVLLFSLIIVAVYYVWRGLPILLKRQWQEARNLLFRTLPSLVLAAVMMSPFLYATWRTISSGRWAKLSNEAIPNDLLSLFMPPVNNIFVGAMASDFGRTFPLQPEPRTFSIGLVGFLIAIYGVVRCKEARWWGVLLAVSIVLALGAELKFTPQSSTGIPLPAKFLNQLPIFEIIRYPRRWIGPASLAIAIASAYALHYQLQRIKNFSVSFRKWRQIGLAVLVVGVFLLEVEPWPIDLSGNIASVPKAYASQVLPKSDHRAILELPIVEKNVAKGNEMYWQTAHQRPILSGYISRPYIFSYNDTPFVYFVDGSRLGQADFVKVEASDLQNLLGYYNFGYIALYKKQSTPPEIDYWRKFTLRLLGTNVRPYHEDDEVVLYQLPEKVGAGSSKASLLRGMGWSEAQQQPDGFYYRWIVEQEATLWLFQPSAKASGKTLVQFQAAAYYRERTMEVLVNGQVVTRLKIGQPLEEHQLEIENGLLKPGYNLITLRPLEAPDRPSVRENSQDTRPLTVLLRDLKLGQP